VTDPGGVILRANQRAGELFACAPQDLVGQPLPDLMAPDDRGSLEAGIGGLEIAEWDAEWIGLAVPATGRPFQLGLTTAQVRHADRSVDRVRWSLRNVSRRPVAD
jgi:PAS domain S-box-containing protein